MRVKMRTCVCNPAALKAAEELHARSKGYSTLVTLYVYIHHVYTLGIPSILLYKPTMTVSRSLSPQRSTTSNRPAHAPPATASVNRKVAIFDGMSFLFSL
jgi:hypothetical protein